MAAISDYQIERMLNAGVPANKANAAAAAAVANPSSVNEIINLFGGKAYVPPTPAAAGTISGTPQYINNGDGTTTVITTYSDGKGGTYTTSQVIGTPTTTGTTGPTGPSTTSSQNAAQMLAAQFKSYGLTGDIASGLLALKQGGLDDSTITSILSSPDPSTILKGMNLTAAQQSSAMNLVNSWNQRFSGNVLREKAGLPPLDPATYIANEDSYKQVMAAAGLPASTITSDYIGKIMAQDVSPAEMQMRINAASTLVNNEDPYVTQGLQQQFGLTTGDMMLHILDPNTAAPLIQNKVAAAQISGEGLRQGLGITSQYAQTLAAAGVTQGQAATGFQSIAAQQAQTQALASRYVGYTQAGDVGQQLQAATFGTPTQTTGETPAQAELRLKRLQAQETSAFGGSSGADTRGQSLGIADQQGVQ